MVDTSTRNDLTTDVRLKLYFDEDSMDDDLVVALRANGIDILTADEAGRRRFSDPQQLAYATSLSRVIYTANARDFVVLHKRAVASNVMHSGIIIRSKQKIPVNFQLAALLGIVATESTESVKNQLRWI